MSGGGEELGKKYYVRNIMVLIVPLNLPPSARSGIRKCHGPQKSAFPLHLFEWISAYEKEPFTWRKSYTFLPYPTVYKLQHRNASTDYGAVEDPLSLKSLKRLLEGELNWYSD